MRTIQQHVLIRILYLIKSVKLYRYTGHIQINQFADEDPPKGDPSDPDCPGHPTDFNPDVASYRYALLPLL